MKNHATLASPYEAAGSVQMENNQHGDQYPERRFQNEYKKKYIRVRMLSFIIFVYLFIFLFFFRN